MKKKIFVEVELDFLAIELQDVLTSSAFTSGMYDDDLGWDNW